MDRIEDLIEEYCKLYKESTLSPEVPTKPFLFDKLEDVMGQISEKLVLLPVEEQVRYVRVLDAKLREMVDQMQLPGVFKVLALPSQREIEALTHRIQKMQETLSLRKKLAEEIVKTFTPEEIKNAFIESLKYAQKDVLLKAREKKKEVKVRGHESCIFLDYGEGTIMIG